MNWYVYIVKCADESLYTGITIDIEKRVKQHNTGKGAKSILGKRPVVVVYAEQHGTHAEAARRELEIKSWKREKKLGLISI